VSFPVAEWALGLILVSLRNAGSFFRKQIEPASDSGSAEDRNKIKDLFGKSVGLIGGGHSAQRLIGFLKPFERKGKKEEPSEFVQKLLKFQDQVVKTCQEKLKNHDQIHKKDQTKATVFAVGSYVLVKYPSKDGKLYTPTKQSSRWQGPYVVKEQKGNTYVLENLVSQMRTEVNVKQLKQYIVREGINLVDVASRDKDEYLVEEVLEMRGEADPKRLRQIEFLVKWMGYDQSFNTWEPYTGLRNNVKLHEFLRKENKSFLIPAEHRNVEERPRKRRRN
jgi:hypothetical protein